MKRYLYSAIALVAVAVSVIMLEACGGSATPESTLKQLIQESNKECPTSIDHITTLKQIKIEDKFVTYECSIDETQLDMDSMIAKRAIYEQNIRNNTAYQLSGMSGNEQFFNLIVEAGMGLRHHYEGQRTRKSMDIDISNDQLKLIAKKARKDQQQH